MEPPVSTLVGSLLLGSGVLLLYGAYKNRRVLGRDGILTTALSKGSITSLDSVPEAVPKDAGSTAMEKAGARASRVPTTTQAAIATIAVIDKSLANNIGAQVALVNESSTHAELVALAQLLAIADARGLSAATAVIRSYVREVTDESI